MATQWTPYTDDVRLGQGFNSYVQETRVNGAVLIKKIERPRKNKVAGKLVTTSRPSSHSPASRDSTTDPSNEVADRDAALSPQSTQRDPGSRRDVSKSEVIGAAIEMHKNGLLDQDAATRLLDLVTSVGGREPEGVAQANCIASIADTKETDLSDEDPRPWSCGFPMWSRKSEKAKSKSPKSGKALDPPASARTFPCNLEQPDDMGNQRVTFISKEVTDQKEINKILGFSSSASVKSGNIGGDAGGSYDCGDDIKEADMTFVVHVRVTNESLDYDETMEFQPIETMAKRLRLDGEKADVEFTKVYGDCFISDFTTGGELFAIIHITTHNKEDTMKIRLHASAQLSPPASPANIGVEMASSEEASSLLKDTETSINLVWRGGGEVKIPHVNWDIPTLMQVANAFPTLVSRSHAKIGAIITPYTSLRSYQEWRINGGLQELTLDYSHCEAFADVLWSEYSDYRDIAADLDSIISAPDEWISAKTQNEDNYAAIVPSPIAKEDLLDPAADTVVGRFLEQGAGEVDSYQLGAKSVRPTVRLATKRPNNAEFNPLDTNPIAVREYEALREARRFCTQAMSKIQRKVRQIEIDPTTAEVFDNYPCPARVRARLPCPKGGDIFDYSDRDQMISAEISVSRSLGYEAKVGDGMNKHRKYEHFSIGNITIKERRRDLYHIMIHPYKHSAWRSRSQMSKDYNNAIAGISFVYCNPIRSGEDSLRTSRVPTKIHTVGKGYPGELPTVVEEQTKFAAGKRSKNVSEETTVEIPPRRLLPLDIKKVDMFYEPGSGYIAGLTFYDGEGVQQKEIAHYQWGKKQDPVPETVERYSWVSGSQSGPFAGLVGSFGQVQGWVARNVLSRCAVIYGVPEGSEKDLDEGREPTYA